MVEEWRQTPYSGYQASNLGRIRGRSGAIMAGVINRVTGYRQYTIIISADKQRKIAGHRLVCETFHGPCPKGMEVAHRNGDKLDNRADNIHWATPEENGLDRVAHGTSRGGASHYLAKVSKEDADEIRSRYSRGGISQRTLGLMYGISQTRVSAITRGESYK